MRLIKSHPILGLVNSYIVDSPQPANISYMWNFGSLLGLVLVIQIVTGLLLSMHYCANTDLAFASTEHLMRDVNFGWLLRYAHANGASFFFIFVYAHVARGLYYGSFRHPRTLVWSIGVIILILMMATAFLGYVLPYGQMSLWGATVITNLLSAIPWIGQSLVEFIWGGFSVSNATLNRFFSLHFLMPFVIAAAAAMHLLALHEHGSGNPLGLTGNIDRLPMHPYFIFKDLVTIMLFLTVFTMVVIYIPNSLGRWPYVTTLNYAICWKFNCSYNSNETLLFSYIFILFNLISLIYLKYTDRVKYHSKNNQQITDERFRYRKLGISETLRVQKRHMTRMNRPESSTDSINWLAGVLDGRCKISMKNNPITLEITLPTKEEKILRQIQNQLHCGSIRSRSQTIQYKISRKKSIIKLTQIINGFLYNPNLVKQFNTISNQLNTQFYPSSITNNNVSLPWLIGYFDARGNVNLYQHYTKDKVHYRNELVIRVGDKLRTNLEPLVVLGGKIEEESGIFYWTLRRKEEHLSFYMNFLQYPCRSSKANKIYLIPEYYKLVEMKAFSAQADGLMRTRWEKLMKKWKE